MKKTKKLRWLQQNVWAEKESVVGLLIPTCTDSASTVCKQPVDEQKTKSYQLSEKGFLFFWTKIKAESREVFVLCCSFCPAIHSSWKTKSRLDPPWTCHQSQAEETETLKHYCFRDFCVLVFCLFSKSSWSTFRLWDISLAALQGQKEWVGGGAAFWLFMWD